MATKENLFLCKNRAAKALQAALILFPSSSAAFPIDNSFQAIFQRLQSSRRAELDETELVNSIESQRDDDGTIDKQDLLEKVAERGLDLLEIIQDWLVLEVDKADTGSSSTEFLLSIQHRALLQRMTQHVVAFLLLPTLQELCRYIARGGPMTAEVPTFRAFIDPFQRFLRLSIPTSRNTSDPATLQTAATQRLPPQHITYVTQTFRNSTTLVHLMAASILVGWYEAVARDPTSPLYRSSRSFLNTLGGRTETISVLGGVVRLTAPTSARVPSRALSGTASDVGGTEKVDVRWPTYVVTVARAMMARQITLPLGVMGLMNCVFGTSLSKTEVVDMRKLEYLAMCVGTPVNESLESFMEKIIPQLIKILAPSTEVSSNRPQAYTNAASFCISHLIAKHTTVVMSLLSPLIHSPFKPEAGTMSSISDQPGPGTSHAIVARHPQRVNNALSILLPLLTSTPPGSVVITQTITPILPQLFALALHLLTDPTADPLTRQEIQDVLRTWARLADCDVVVRGIWEILHSGRGWGVTDEEKNEFFWDYVEEADVEQSGIGIWYGTPRPRPIFAPHKASESDASGIEIKSCSNLEDASSPGDPEAIEQDMLARVKLTPPPQDIVSLLKRAERREVTSGVYFRCLQAYQQLAQSRDTDEADTKDLLRYLQLIMLITESMADALGDQTKKVLIFVEQSLRSSLTEKEKAIAQNRQNEGDSDDEEDEESRKDEVQSRLTQNDDLETKDITKLGLTETAIHLLLVTLQTQSRIDAEDLPILAVISSHVELLERHPLASVRALARNARLLLSIHQAVGQNDTTGASDEALSSTMKQYQEALRCLQDPLLPVRGHGLIILQGVVKAPDFDKALVPAIMDIFLQALRDDDSFMYLNAVRGLSSLVDGLGKEILRSLSSAYMEGLDRGTSLDLSKEELDCRLRIGEALTQSVKRCGTALSIYADALIPRMLRVFPQAHLPTVLRASSLSILSTCVDVDWKATLPWVQDLLGGCLDLLQLESVRSSRRRELDPQADASNHVGEPIRGHDSKHPALRRAALVFVGQLFNAVGMSQKEEYDTANAPRGYSRAISVNIGADQRNYATGVCSPPLLHLGLLQKASNVLGHLQATDVDSLAAHQAGEALSLLRQLR